MKPAPQLLRAAAIITVLLCCVVSSALFSGCASTEYGTKLDRAKVSQIKRGVTTRVEVEALLGSPLNVSMMGDGKRIMFYSYSSTTARANPASFIPYVGLFTSAGKGEMQTQMLQVVINQSGIVEDFEFSEGANQIEAGAMGMSMKTTPAAPPSTTAKN